MHSRARAATPTTRSTRHANAQLDRHVVGLDVQLAAPPRSRPRSSPARQPRMAKARPSQKQDRQHAPLLMRVAPALLGASAALRTRGRQDPDRTAPGSPAMRRNRHHGAPGPIARSSRPRHDGEGFIDRGLTANRGDAQSKSFRAPSQLEPGRPDSRSDKHDAPTDAASSEMPVGETTPLRVVDCYFNRNRSLLVPRRPSGLAARQRRGETSPSCSAAAEAGAVSKWLPRRRCGSAPPIGDRLVFVAPSAKRVDCWSALPKNKPPTLKGLHAAIAIVRRGDRN